MGMEDRRWAAAFTGYRDDKFSFPLEGTHPRYLALRARLEAAVRAAAADGRSTFYCGAARGFDIVAGETVLALRCALGLRLRCLLPFPGSDALWRAPWRARYARLMDGADSVEAIAPRCDRTCYFVRDRALVDRASLVICYYDGRSGGTAYTLRYAARRGLPVVNVCDACAQDLPLFGERPPEKYGADACAFSDLWYNENKYSKD